MRWFKFYSARPRVEFTYGVYTSGSRSEELRQTLKLVSGHGGRVISVTWQPHGAGGPQQLEEGYVVVAEFQE